MHNNIRILTWFNFFTDFKLYAPIAILYFTQVSGSFALGMSIFSVAMISSALFEIPTGVFSDRIGRKKTIILGALASTICVVLYAIGSNYWFLFIGAVLEGLSRSFYSGNNDALLHDVLAEQNQENNYDIILGKTSSMFQFALAISGLLGALIAPWSLALIVWISVVPQSICLLLATRIKEPRKSSTKSGNVYTHLKEAYKNFVSNKKLRLLSLSSILGFGYGEAGYQFQAAFYSSIWPVWAVALAKTTSHILAAISFRLSGKVIRKFGAYKLLLIDNIYIRIVNITSTLFPTIFSPLLMSSTSALFGIVVVAKNSLMQKEFTNEQRATMGSLNSFAASIFYGIVAVLLGFVADLLNPAKALLILQFFQLLNFAIYWRLFKRYSKD
jgi:MFS family permease